MARESTTPTRQRTKSASTKIVAGRTLVTGFGPFGTVSRNPSGFLAEQSGREHRLLEVSYRAVREFLARLDPESFDRLLLLGVAAGATKCRVELFARNLIGPTPDVHGEVPGPREIVPNAPRVLGGTLWDGTRLLSPKLIADHPRLVHSFSAGAYLCNYVYFEALLRFREKRVGFLHVPLEDDMPLEEQLAGVKEVIDEIERVPVGKGDAANG